MSSLPNTAQESDLPCPRCNEHIILDYELDELVRTKCSSCEWVAELEWEKAFISVFLSAWNKAMGSKYRVVSWPDKIDSQGEAVDAIAVHYDGTVTAIEHTLLQPYCGEKDDSARFKNALAPLHQEASLRQLEWDIIFSAPVGAIPKGRGCDRSQVYQIVKVWLMENVSKFPEGRSKYTIPSLPFNLEITVSKGRRDSANQLGNFIVARDIPPDSLPSVLRSAFKKKVPKLKETQADRRFLLLEKDDILSSIPQIEDAIVIVRSELADCLDSYKIEVWLGTTLPPKFEELYPNFRRRRMQGHYRVSLPSKKRRNDHSDTN